MSLITDIYLDMDNTLMDFSRGNLERALSEMKDPDYYRKVTPFEGALDMLGDMTDDYSIHIVSGIPDLVRHHEYLGDMTPREYIEYYQAVKENKLEMLNKYFGKGFFSSIEFTKASESKASIIKTRFYNNSTKEFQHTALCDDIQNYVVSWRKLGGHGFVVSTHKPLTLVLNDIKEMKY